MGLFGSRTKKPFAPPPGLNTTPQGLVRSARFEYDGGGQPAVSLTKVQSSGSGAPAVSLVKGYQAAQQALTNVDLAGIRMEVIVLLDGSGSMYDEYQRQRGQELSIVEKLLVRTLGFCLNVDRNGKIPVIVYGRGVNAPVDIDLGNYQRAPQLIKPDFGTTNMTGALRTAMQLANANDILTLIVNITDGDPNDRVSMSNEVIASSGHPVFLKNLAIKLVPYLEEIDDLPSRNEIQKDASGNPVKDGQDMLVLETNPAGLRLIDNVDSQEVDPFTATDEQFARIIAEEISSYVEVAARVGLLTDVPGVDRTVF